MQIIRIYSKDMGIGFGIEKCVMLRSGKDKKWKELECQIKKALEHLEKRKITSTCDNLRRTPHTRRNERKSNKSTSDERENFLKLSSVAGFWSKE